MCNWHKAIHSNNKWQFLSSLLYILILRSSILTAGSFSICMSLNGWGEILFIVHCSERGDERARVHQPGPLPCLLPSIGFCLDYLPGLTPRGHLGQHALQGGNSARNG